MTKSARVKRLAVIAERIPQPETLGEDVESVIVYANGKRLEFTGSDALQQARAVCPEAFGPDSVGVTVRE